MGEARAGSLGQRLQGIPFDAAFSSPLRRARDTARLAGFPDAVLTDLLREWDYGDYEGLTSVQIHETVPSWDLWAGGCPGGETPTEVIARARRFLDQLPAAATRVIAFSHGHFIRAIALAFLGLPAAAGARLALDTAALSVLRAGDRGGVVQLWNDVGHLPV